MKRPMAIIATVFVCLLNVVDVFSAKYSIESYIESVRKNNVAVLLFKNQPDSKKYLILFEEKIIGEASILSTVKMKSNVWKIRAVAEFSLYESADLAKMKAGNELVLAKPVAEKFDSTKPYFIEKRGYEKRITTTIDGREMIWIPAGKFILGANDGDNDERPAKAVYVPHFYIDKLEVSNSSYLSYMKHTNSPAPQSWKNGTFEPGTGDLPVMVTFFEAAAYAKWAGKRLPTEQEWEKAARGTAGLYGETEPFIYPWGNKFNSEKANSLELWETEETGKFIKEKYCIKAMGLMQVISFDDGASPFGVMNMSGNAPEWTASWYMPYSGNKQEDRKFGKQYKVIRGGGYYSDRLKIRVTARSAGGTPNLYSDNTAGFRCAKDVFTQDRSR